MTWGRALNKALRAAGVPSTFTKWRDLAAHRDQWRVLCGAKARGTVYPPPKAPPRHLGPGRPLPTALQHRPPTRQRRQRAHGANSHAPRLQPPSSTPLRSGGLPLWATTPSPEPGPRGRTKPRPATPAPKPGLTSPSAFQQNTGTRKMTRERDVSCTQPSRQPNAGGATDAHTPTPPAACDRNALSAL